MIDVVVIGAGISGLTLACRQQELGNSVLVLDKNLKPGGILGTLRVDGFQFDQGANTLLADAEIQEWLRNLGLESSIVVAGPAARKRYLYVDGALEAVPSGPLSLLRTRLISARAKWQLLREWNIPPQYHPDDTVADFFRRHLGSEIVETMVKPVIGGIFAGDAETMGIAGAFPSVVAMENEHGSLLRAMISKRRARSPEEKKQPRRKTLAFRGGMDELVGALASRLGGNLLNNAQIRDIYREDATGKWIVSVSHPEKGEWQIQCQKILVTAPAYAAAALVEDRYPHVAASLAAIDYSPVIQIFTGFRRNKLRQKPDAFGFLVPPKSNKPLLGAVWNSAVFPNRAPEGAEAFTLFAGGALNKDAVLHHPELLVKQALACFSEIMGAEEAPEVLEYRVFERAIPHPGTHHTERLEALKKAEETLPGLQFYGNYRNGISLRELIIAAKHSE